MNYSENAVYAKVHALFAKCLTGKDYEALLTAKNNDELLNYLKSSTAYSEYLASLPAAPSCRRLESELHSSLLSRKAAIFGFQKLLGDGTYRYFVKKDEIETVLYCARHLDSSLSAVSFARPSVYAKEQTVSGERLFECTSFDEFAAALLGTPYGKLTEPLFARSAGYKSLAALERVLYNSLYAETSEAITKSFKGKERKEILDYLKFTSDMLVISSLYRLLTNYPEDKNYKTGIFAPSLTAFTDKDLRAFEGSDSPEELITAVRASVYGKHFKEKFEDIDLFTRQLIIEESVKNIRYSRNPVLALFCYETVLNNEIQNLIHIAEGIRYRLSPEEISHIIVKGGC